MATIKNYHVPAGTFHVSDRRSLVLQAYLGTCVGLGIYCRSTGIGGIIHLLLPEPISPSSYNQPEKYASTGIPLFIQSLIDAGARTEALAACLAGGALVGPLQKQDLDLDIGGRTAEVAKKILKSQGIEVVHSETGGFFTCCLSLDMASGQFSIEPAGYAKLPQNLAIKSPSSAEIKQAMDRLKPIPQVALKVLRLIDQNSYAIETIAEEIRQDQVISARTLQLANSAMFAVKRAIDTLDHAIVFLGQDLLVKLVITAAVQSYYEQSAMGYALCKGGIYHHAIGCAQVAEALARKSRRVEPGRAYTAGLLHDIGKVVLDQYVTEAYPLFYRQVIEKMENTVDTEKRFIGIDHTEVGFMLARQWSFPPALVNTIRHHHHPEKAGEHSDLTLIVYLADLLMSRFHSGLEIERLDTNTLTTHLESLAFKTDDFADLVDTIPSVVFKSIGETTIAYA